MRALFVLSLLLVGCASSGPKVKVYYLDQAQGGLVRKQEKETLSFEKAKGYRCMSPQDFDTLVLYLRARGGQ